MNFNNIISDRLNVNQIVSIKTHISEICFYYEYKKKRKYFSFLFPKEGFYDKCTMGSPIYKTNEQIEGSKKLFIVNNNVFYKPHIEIKMSNGCIYNKFF